MIVIKMLMSWNLYVPRRPVVHQLAIVIVIRKPDTSPYIAISLFHGTCLGSEEEGYRRLNPPPLWAFDLSICATPLPVLQ